MTIAATHAAEQERIFELLAQRAIEGLSPGETGELRLLLVRHPQIDPDMFDAAVAWVDIVCTPPVEMPDALKAQLLAQGQAVLKDTTPSKHEDARDGVVVRPAPAFWRRPAPAWLAAAASVVLALGLWMRGPVMVEVPVEVTRIVEVAPQPAAPEFRRASLLQEAHDLQRQSWQVTEGYATLSVEGDVVWSPQRQEGYMRFAGLPANDPQQNQYQLWVFDATRDDSFPVDGGVFDVAPGSAETIVPITTNLAVRKASLFAVTREPAGGVMVSSREELMLVAATDSQ